MKSDIIMDKPTKLFVYFLHHTKLHTLKIKSTAPFGAVCLFFQPIFISIPKTNAFRKSSS